MLLSGKTGLDSTDLRFLVRSKGEMCFDRTNRLFSVRSDDKCALDRTVLRVFVLLGSKNGLDRTDLCFFVRSGGEMGLDRTDRCLFVRSGGWWIGYIRRDDVSDGRKDYTFGLISGQFGFRAQIQACFWTAFEWFCVREKKTASISCASDHVRQVMCDRSCASDHAHPKPFCGWMKQD